MLSQVIGKTLGPCNFPSFIVLYEYEKSLENQYNWCASQYSSALNVFNLSYNLLGRDKQILYIGPYLRYLINICMI